MDMFFFTDGWFLLPLVALGLAFGAGRLASRRARSIALWTLLLLPLAPFTYFAAAELQGHNAAAVWMLMIGLAPLALWEACVLLVFSIGRRTSRPRCDDSYLGEPAGTD
jgi:hypothetical protein